MARKPTRNSTDFRKTATKSQKFDSIGHRKVYVFILNFFFYIFIFLYIVRNLKMRNEGLKISFPSFRDFSIYKKQCLCVCRRWPPLMAIQVIRLSKIQIRDGSGERLIVGTRNSVLQLLHGVCLFLLLLLLLSFSCSDLLLSNFVVRISFFLHFSLK